MDLERADELIATYLSANWEDTPIAWANVEPREFSAPGQPLLPAGDEDFVQVRSHLVSNTNISGSCVRSAMNLQLSICLKAGTGSRRAKKHLSGLVLLLENAKIGSSGERIRIGTMIGSVSYFSDNGWYIEDASFPFHFERSTALP